MKPIDKAREEMTAADASAEHAEFMKHTGMVLDAAVKLKKIMVAKGLGRAKAECPKCHVVGALHGVLIVGKGAGRHRSSGGAFRMWCETAGCGVSMME